jgi:hypothetical protein
LEAAFFVPSLRIVLAVGHKKKKRPEPPSDLKFYFKNSLVRFFFNLLFIIETVFLILQENALKRHAFFVPLTFQRYDIFAEKKTTNIRSFEYAYYVDN